MSDSEGWMGVMMLRRFALQPTHLPSLLGILAGRYIQVRLFPVPLFLLFFLESTALSLHSWSIKLKDRAVASMTTYNDGSSPSLPGHKHYNEKYQQDVAIANATDFDDETHHYLHRGLKARQITMIAIGGAIGTGLIIGT